MGSFHWRNRQLKCHPIQFAYNGRTFDQKHKNSNHNCNEQPPRLPRHAQQSMHRGHDLHIQHTSIGIYSRAKTGRGSEPVW